MARLPGMTHVMQQSGGIVRLFEDGSEREITVFDPADGLTVIGALNDIRRSDLGDEDKCFALLWAGYFHAHADRDPEVPREQFVFETEDGGVVVLDGRTEIVRFDPASRDAMARAQLPVHLSGLSQDAKDRAHFWSGFHYAHANTCMPGRLS